MYIILRPQLVFFGCLATVSAVSGHFPHGKTVVYKYHSDVKAGTAEPASYASQFTVDGTLYVKHDTTDPTLRNAYYVVLSDVTNSMHNGKTTFPSKHMKLNVPISNLSRNIEEPFLIIYDENGKLQGVKIPSSDPGWSKNMKMAIASMLQLDLPSMKIEESTTPRNFMSKENTIHGDCWTSYDIRAKHSEYTGSNEIIVSKFLSPKNCTGFVVYEFDHVENEGCQAKAEEPLDVTSHRLYEIEKQGKDDVLIKKLIAHGSFNYIPWNARSGAHHVVTNTTLILDKILPDAQGSLQSMNFKNVPIIRDLTYQKPQAEYETDAAADITQGRHPFDPLTIQVEMIEMLGEAADYLEKNHFNVEEPKWKHLQIINRISRTMKKMSATSLKYIFDIYKKSIVPREFMMKRIFLALVQHIGTKGSTLFALQLIRAREISPTLSVKILATLPMNVRKPDEQLIIQMEDFVKLNDSYPIEVRKAGILSFASMLYRTFKDLPNPEESPLLQKYLQNFFEHVKNEPNSEMKSVYLMALKNVQIGKIPELLAPIIRGDLPISDDPTNIRCLAIWAITKPIESNYHYARELLWPIMANKILPVKLRIAAYEILMHQAPTTTDVLNIHEFMIDESSNQLYNYHYTTIKAISNSVDPCKLNLRENVRKIMRNTKIRDNHSRMLSHAYSIGYEDEKYDHAERINAAMLINEVTKIPEILHFEHITTDARKPVSNFAIRVHMIRRPIREYSGFFARASTVTTPNVLDILKEAAKDMPAGVTLMDYDILLMIMSKGRVVSVSMNPDPSLFLAGLTFEIQDIMYDHLYEKHMISDMGLPVVLENRVPLLRSLKIENMPEGGYDLLNIDGKIWRHGDYSMSIYNPIADAWHSISRRTATDIGISIHVNRTVARDMKDFVLTQITSLLRNPNFDLPIVGFRTHAKDTVSIDEHSADINRYICRTCNTEIDISSGEPLNDHYEIDSKDIGLMYSMTTFDCESKTKLATLNGKFYEALMSDRMNDMSDVIVRTGLALHRHFKNMINSPDTNRCGILFNIKPSTRYPISRIDLYSRAKLGDRYLDYSIDLTSGASNTSALMWTLTFNKDIVQFDRSILQNAFDKFEMRMVRKTPGETNRMICINWKKSIPEMTNPLKLAIDESEEVNSVLKIAVERTDGKECSYNETLVEIKIKGEHSNEQVKQFNQEITNGACSDDIKNPLYANPKNLVPKTLNCLDTFARSTTLMKYTIDVTHKKVPHDAAITLLTLEDTFRAVFLPKLNFWNKHSEPGNIRIYAEFSESKDSVGLIVMEPTYSYAINEIDLGKGYQFDGFRTTAKPMQYWGLYNTRVNFLTSYMYAKGGLGMCSVYPKTIMNVDGVKTLYNLSDRWTLIYGDQNSRSFAVFAKMIGKNMAVHVVHAAISFENNNQDELIDIVPSADDNVQVTVNGNVIESMDTSTLKITRINDHIFLSIKRDMVPFQSLILIYGLNHIAFVIESKLDTQRSGLCGFYNATESNEIPHIYTLSNL